VTIKAQTGLPGEGRDNRHDPTSSVVVEIDAGRRAAARTHPNRVAPPRAAAPTPRGLDDAAFHGALGMARKAWDEGNPIEARIHLGWLVRMLKDGDAA
jgi:hypothetical protein